MSGNKEINNLDNGLPLVSIIIPHFNGEDILVECLQSLNKSNYSNLEIIIVDNCSTDNSISVVKKKFSSIKVIYSKVNKGYAGGCNLGARSAKGDYFFFLNNDTVQKPDCINELMNTMLSDSSITVVQPKILNYFNQNLFDYAGGSGGYLDVFCFPFARGRLFHSKEIDKGQYDDENEIFWASGTGMLIKKNDFINIGCFDEFFFAHQEEIDLQWKLHLLNKKIKVNPSGILYHKNAMTLSSNSIKKHYLNHRNSLLMMMTNYSLLYLAYTLPVRLILELIALIYSLFLLDMKHVLGIMKSLTWILFNPIQIFRRRKNFNRLYKRNDKKIFSKMYRKSIVFDFFILRKKNYGDLDIAS